MHDIQLEDRLRNALRAEAEALPFTVTIDDLNARLATRKRGRMNRFGMLSAAAAIVVVVGVGTVLYLGRGQVPPVGVTPSPSVQASGQASPVPMGTPHPLASFDELIAITGGDPIALQAGRAGDPTHGDDDLETYVVGHVVDIDQFMDVAWDCVGDDPFGVSWRSPADGSVFVGFESPSCAGPAEIFTGGVPADADLVVTASPRTSWRVVAYRPEAEAGETPSDPVR